MYLFSPLALAVSAGMRGVVVAGWSGIPIRPADHSVGAHSDWWPRQQDEPRFRPAQRRSWLTLSQASRNVLREHQTLVHVITLLTVDDGRIALLAGSW